MPHILKAGKEERHTSQERSIVYLEPLDSMCGFAFGCFIVQGRKSRIEKIQNLLHQELASLKKITPEENLTHRFESFLEHVNEELATYAKVGEIDLKISDTASVVGIANESTVVVSGFGNISAQFLHKTSGEGFDIFDLSRGLRVEEEAPSWEKAYLTVLDGDISSGDVLFIGTRVNRHDVPPNEMNELLTTLPPKGALSRIKQQIPNTDAFTGIVLKADPEACINASQNRSAESSLRHLHLTKEETEIHVDDHGPSIGASLLRGGKALFVKKRHLKGAQSSIPKRVVQTFLRLILVILTLAVHIGFGAIKSTFYEIRSSFAKPKETLNKFINIVRAFQCLIKTKRNAFHSLPNVSKVASFIGLSVLLILIISIFFIRQHNTKQAEQDAFENTLMLIQEEIQQAEASAIYGNEAMAWETLLRAQASLESLGMLDEEILNEAVLELSITLEDQKNTIRKIEQVEHSLIHDETTINKLTEIISTEEQLSKFSVNRNGIDFALYSGKLYVLSPENGQIYKHLAQGEGYDGGTAWVVSGVSNLTDAVSLTIDGYIWILKADGEILRFLSGREDDWALGTVDPTLAGATRIWTDETSNYLYVLHSSEHRIVVIEKSSGNLVVQYVFEGEEALKFLIQENNRKAIISTPTEVFSFDLTHL